MVLFCGRTLPLFGRVGRADRGLGRWQLSLIWFHFGGRPACLGPVLGVCGVCGQFADLSPDWAQVAQQHFKGLLIPVLLAIGLVTLGRAAAVYPLCAVFVRTRFKVDMRHQHVLFWGGLRGALALALSLSVPAELPRRDCHRRDYVCRRRLLSVRTRIDDHPAAAPTKADQVRQRMWVVAQPINLEFI